jgi:ubiquinone/menaquinone biosynthesis C-methylase UbiE
MLNRARKFPHPGDKCLEIGYGKLGWLADLISWGVRECDLYGIELDGTRASIAKTTLPSAHLEVGDAASIPWPDDYFDLVVASTVFSSIQQPNVRRLIARDIDRVLSHGGAVVLYDTAVNNPANKNLYRIGRRDIAGMFPGYKCFYRSITLAPPIARFTAKWSWTAATLLSGVPFLRTHFLAVLLKN